MLLTTKQVCERLRISRTTLWRLVRRGVLRPVPLPIRDLRFNPKDIEVYEQSTVSTTTKSANNRGGQQ
ncbi:MAG: helix-turn-helix domain-containing protein [Chlorobi bacterium]|nr:helix-turn-helix domain-containing protein [Chlorobiota bacterium]